MGHFKQQLKKTIFILSAIIFSFTASGQYKKNLQTIIVSKTTDLTGMSADTGQIAIPLDTQFPQIFNGLVWMPSSRTIVYRSAVTVTGTATGTTLVYTLPSTPLKFYPFMIVIRAVNVSGVTTSPTVSVGTNSTSYNNIATASLLSTVLSTVGASGGAPQSASTSVPITGGTGIYAKVTIAGVATTYTFNVDIIGFYDIN